MCAVLPYHTNLAKGTLRRPCWIPHAMTRFMIRNAKGVRSFPHHANVEPLDHSQGSETSLSTCTEP